MFKYIIMPFIVECFCPVFSPLTGMLIIYTVLSLLIGQNKKYTFFIFTSLFLILLIGLNIIDYFTVMKGYYIKTIILLSMFVFYSVCFEYLLKKRLYKINKNILVIILIMGSFLFFYSFYSLFVSYDLNPPETPALLNCSIVHHSDDNRNTYKIALAKKEEINKVRDYLKKCKLEKLSTTRYAKMRHCFFIDAYNTEGNLIICYKFWRKDNELFVVDSPYIYAIDNEIYSWMMSKRQRSGKESF